MSTDEIALDFDDAFRTADSLAAEKHLSGGAMADLREIDAALAGMGGEENAVRWTPDALSGDEGWAAIRQLARRVLAQEVGDWRQSLPDITVVR
ncbi:hypothetical protein QNO07_02765 [Streptomyces sp. 549]|uniref:hypothetical protein n=1 Tax=Streptomyces sp. 549 TaxID=3049076 RepID=UPI0024C3D8C1|nr:hypothetical protein [Streptomyces sp. 549]MDK1472356.1 hypothetical protein [Streptomyces sp. 549]